MLRGAIILGIGFSLGYAKALHDSEEIKDKLTQILDLAKEADNRRQQESNKEDTGETVTADAVDITAETTVPPTPRP